MRLTPVQEQLLNEIQARGGRVRSLRNLTGEIGIDYKHARGCLADLEDCGFVGVNRAPGLALEIFRKY